MSEQSSAGSTINLVPLLDQFAEMVAAKVVEIQSRQQGPLTVAEFCEAIGGALSDKTVRAYIDAGKIGKIENSPKLLIPHSEVERFTK